MTVELDYLKLSAAAESASTLATDIRTNVAAARAASPVSLPSLAGLEAKATYLDEQADVLTGLADIALLLDESGEGTVSLPLASITESINDLLGEYLGAEFANIFGNDEDFPLISLASAIGKMSRMSKGVAPIFQTGFLGRNLLPRLASGTGRTAEWARWMLSGARHGGPPPSLLSNAKWMQRWGTHYPSAGWGPLTSGGRLTGLGVTRYLGVAGGVVNTGVGLANLIEQGNPIDAFEREGAGYVADVAETAFSASTTAFLVAPNPVTGALAVTSGVVWVGAEVVDHWDEIAETASDVWDGVTDLASQGGDLLSEGLDKLTFWD